MSEPKRSWRFRGGAPGPRGNRTDGRGFDENSSNGRGGRGGFRGGRGGGRGGFGKRNRDDDNHDGDGEVRERDFKARRGAWNASEQQRPPRERAEDEEKVRKNKMVLLVAYKGTGYQGLQINPGAKTLEGDIEEAIYKAGFLSEDNHNDLSKVKWSRAARTDKGVHAAGNIISLKMSVPDEHLMPAAALAEYRAAEVDTRAQLKALVERAKATQTAEFVQLVKEFEEKEVALAAAAPAAGAAAEGEADASADIPVAAPVAPGEVVYVDATPVRVASRTPDVAAIVSEVAKLKEQLSQRHSTLVDEGYASGCISSGVNAHLPAQIRVLRAERVANAFDAKLNATSRTYEYILPSFAFLPVDKYPEGLHKAMLSAVPPLSGAAESAPVAEAEGSADAGAAADAAAAAAAGQAAAGERVPVAKSGLESVATQTLLKVLRKMDTEEKEEKDTPDAFSGPAGAVQAGRGKGKGKEKATEEGDAESEVSENDADADNANANVSDLAAMVRASLAELGIPECPPELLNYRMTPEDRARVDGILSAFIGTKNHHNLTKGRSPSDPSCMRYIDSFVTTGLFYMNGVEFVHLVVHGQSFMLHQIRKMVGYSVALARGTLAPEAVDTVFTKQRVRVPMAPALGLLLDRIHFKGYDLKTLEAAERARARGRLGDVRGTLDSMYAAVAAERTAFKEQNIYAEICARELALQSCWTWLHWANDIGYWGKTFTAEDEGPPVRRSGHAAARQLKQHAAAAQQVSAVEDQGKEGIEYVNVVKDTTAMLPSYAKAAEEEAGEAAKDQVQ